MSCMTVKFGDTTAIVCGSFPEAKRCACGSPSTILCDWPVLVEEHRRADRLKVGEMIIPFSMGSVNTRDGHIVPDQEARKVLSVKHVEGFVSIVWQGRTEPSSPVAYRQFAYIRVVKPGTCSKPCCDAHSRSVDDGRDYCYDHALSQETIT